MKMDTMSTKQEYAWQVVNQDFGGVNKSFWIHKSKGNHNHASADPSKILVIFSYIDLTCY